MIVDLLPLRAAYLSNASQVLLITSMRWAFAVAMEPDLGVLTWGYRMARRDSVL